MLGFLSKLSSTPMKMMQIAYFAGFTLIAGVSFGAHYIVGQVIEQNRHAAPTINIAGQQRMLSQRTAYLLSQANLTGNKSTLYRLKLALDQFSQNHFDLVHGNEERGLSATLPPEVKKIYFTGVNALDPKMIFHLSNLNEFYTRIMSGETIPVSEITPTLVAAEKRLLKRLNLVVAAFETDAKTKVADLLKLQELSLVILIVALLAECLLIFAPLSSRIRSYGQKLKKAAMRDPLTNLFNRPSFIEQAETELDLCRTNSSKLSVLLLDIDDLKTVNTQYGTQAGDAVIKSVASSISSVLRKSDVVARIDGEEFAILLPETKIEDTGIVAEKLLKAVRETRVVVDENTIEDITASIGITDVLGSARNQTADSILLRAYVAMDDAKKRGCNQYQVRDASTDFQDIKGLRLVKNTA